MNTDAQIKSILGRTRRIALVGASAKPSRPSYQVMQFLLNAGYDVVPVNPGLAGQTLLGQPVAARLSDIEGEIDMVDIFRQSDRVPEIVDEALARFPQLGAIWMQIGVMHEAAAETARARGVEVVMNRCPKMEYPRLMS